MPCDTNPDAAAAQRDIFRRMTTKERLGLLLMNQGARSGTAGTPYR
jgi:hypothetical protein